ncbi:MULTISPECIES: Crp/Fnr family transcriptional regulator [unclassified Motilimonas]|uniref:Crp/Fnr family transcriptional regulator n=1 Tax=Motilimonas TaxID=1914248 RepID=UPI001E30F6C4|nr:MULTISPECIES: Crp/Fnr family transcriptional regulator [unclassified Motilimonas]MCE0558370.1 Crp/Fnr family transcriptional regulator [Motilimonas sp. E26]MDO6525278.1 Crp/Fnr family transcriptional regulator [Motilimonas sp. 1_MG-2023]
MISLNDKTLALAALKQALNQYHKLEETTWQAMQNIVRLSRLNKGQVLYEAGVTPSTFAFVYQGLVRAYALDEKGVEYNKKFFIEGEFPGSMSALLTKAPSQVTIAALEPSLIIEIDFAAYRKLLARHHDLALLQIAYLEKNWLLEKDAREIELVLTDASQRYQRFLTEHSQLAARLTQYQIASHLGVTPTQLSRIRKQIAAD